MTIRELFEKLRTLPDWDVKLRVKGENLCYEVASVGVGEFSGEVYLSVDNLVPIEELVEEI